MFQIADIIIKNPIICAPMAGITNSAFRTLAYRNGAALTYSEMVSDKGITYHNQKTLDLLHSEPFEHPFTIQLFGHDIASLREAVVYVNEHTACDIIDINMGCPVNKVIKAGAGSALMQDPPYAFKLIKELVKISRKPITVKMRLGYYADCDYLAFAKGLEAAGIAALAVHGRTRCQMYEGQADWDKIKDIKEHLKIPVIGNGDIKSADDFFDRLAYSKVDGIMLGRGIIGNPFLIKEIHDRLNGLESKPVTVDERFDALREHYLSLIDLYGEKIAGKQMRGLAPHYLSGLPSSAHYRSVMNQIDDYHEMDELLKEYRLYLQSKNI